MDLICVPHLAVLAPGAQAGLGVQVWQRHGAHHLGADLPSQSQERLRYGPKKKIY